MTSSTASAPSQESGVPSAPICSDDDFRSLALQLRRSKDVTWTNGEPQIEIIVDNRAVANLLSGQACLESSQYHITQCKTSKQKMPRLKDVIAYIYIYIYIY